MRHIIYALVDPEEPQLVRYVGYTSQHPDLRMRGHRSEAKHKNRNRKQRWMTSLANRGLQPQVIELEEVTAENWKERETYWIAFHAGPKLTNSTQGGEGLINPSQDVRDRIAKTLTGKSKGNTISRPHTEEEKKRISVALRNSPAYKAAVERRRGKPGHPQSTESRDKTRQAKLGKKRPPFSKEWRENLGRSRVGIKQRPETIAKRALSLIGNQRAKGYVHSASARRLIAEARIGSKWITDGSEVRKLLAGVALPQGWAYGFIKRSRQ